MINFYGEPVSAIVLLYLNLLLQIFGKDERVVRAFVKALRTIRAVKNVVVPREIVKPSRPGKKERFRRKQRKAGTIKKESQMKKSSINRLERRKQRRKLKDEERRKSNKVKQAALNVENIQLKYNNLRSELDKLSKEGQLNDLVLQKFGLTSERRFEAKPCLSCVCDKLKMRPCYYSDKHFVEKMAFCFKKKDLDFSVEVKVRYIEILVKGYKPISVGLEKFYSFLIQYSVIPHYSPEDKSLKELLKRNMSLVLGQSPSLADHYAGFRLGYKMVKTIVQHKNLKLIENCYPFIVASLFSSVENVGLPIAKEKTDSPVVEKLQVVPSGRTIPETPNPFGGNRSDSIISKSITALTVPAVSEPPKKKLVLRPVKIEEVKPEPIAAPMIREPIRPLGVVIDRFVKELSVQKQIVIPIIPKEEVGENVECPKNTSVNKRGFHVKIRDHCVFCGLKI